MAFQNTADRKNPSDPTGPVAAVRAVALHDNTAISSPPTVAVGGESRPAARYSGSGRPHLPNSRLRCHSLSMKVFAATSSAAFSSGASTKPRSTPRFFMSVTAQLRGFLAGTRIRERDDMPEQ